MQPNGEASDNSVEVSFGVADLPELRRLVGSTALSAGLTGQRAEDLVLAVNEIATNALIHGRPPATLRIRSAGRELVCEVSDAGEGIKDVLAGQLAPPATSLRGRGLWITRLLCDAVEVGNGEGCTVSMHVTTPSGHPAV
jgi:anti-sigma regulatory factor (Ser/Thr protein kinase)